MTRQHHAPQLGAPDPEQRNSPILDRSEENEMPSLDNEIESAGCYFNGKRFLLGDFVRSGDELLHCAARGVWEKVTEERLT